MLDQISKSFYHCIQQGDLISYKVSMEKSQGTELNKKENSKEEISRYIYLT